ncbi:MAG: sugar phosphate isomerase/epimerase family protein [Kiritimatiellia bacterium]
MNLSRKSFLTQLGLGALGLGTGACTSCPVFGASKPKIGVQLYSIRNLCVKDLAATLKGVAEIGYKGIEFYRWSLKYSPAELKKMLDDNGLVTYGSHTSLSAIFPENLNKTFDELHTLGQPGMCVPWMHYNSVAGWQKIAETFNNAAEKGRKEGLYIGYHCHESDFRDKYDGKTAWEIFADATIEDVVFEYDTANILAAGEDPVTWINRYRRHVKALHVKELYGAKAPGILGQPPPGRKGVDWDAVFAATRGVTKYYIVESETNPGSLDSVKGCFDYLRARGLA